MTTAMKKISVSLERQVVSWLRKRAAKLDVSVSALLSEAAVRERQRAERIAFAREVGMEVPTPKELHAELLAILGCDTDKEVTVLDVRPPEEYRAGHIPGALSIPVGELKARLKELPKGREVVAYCRGPYCAMAVEAVELLRKKGFKALFFPTQSNPCLPSAQ